MPISSNFQQLSNSYHCLRSTFQCRADIKTSCFQLVLPVAIVKNRLMLLVVVTCAIIATIFALQHSCTQYVEAQALALRNSTVFGQMAVCTPKSATPISTTILRRISSGICGWFAKAAAALASSSIFDLILFNETVSL